MTSSNTTIQSLSNNSVSLSEIVKSMQGNEVVYKFYKNHGIQKIFFKHLSRLTLQVSNINDVKNSEILCYGFGKNVYTMKKIVVILFYMAKECFENVYYIGIDVKDDTRMMSENDRIFLAKKYAYFIEILYEKCCNASKLWLTNRNHFSGNDNFLLYILERLKTDKVIEIKPIFLEDILSYSIKNDFGEFNLFLNMPNLKVFSVEIFTNELPSYYSDCITPMKKLINCLSKNKNITLDMYIEGTNKSINIASEILNYANEINFNINIKQSSGWIEYFQEINYTITDDFLKIINNLTTVSLFIHIIDDFKIIKSFMTSLQNLKSISLHIDKDIIERVYKQYNDMESYFLQIKECFNFKSTIKKLTEFRLHQLCLSNDKEFFQFYLIQ